jgi:hypothetical protein
MEPEPARVYPGFAAQRNATMSNNRYTRRANFGMALPYFLEVVELQDGIAVAGEPVTHDEIGQVFGDQTVIVFGRTSDGQLWRLIYPNETATCWVMPCRAKPSVQFITYPQAGECSNASATPQVHRRTP